MKYNSKKHCFSFTIKSITKKAGDTRGLPQFQTKSVYFSRVFLSGTMYPIVQSPLED